MNKEDFKQLRLEAGFSSDAEFLREMGYLSASLANTWFNGLGEYPKFLRNVFFLFKLRREFDMKKYKEFLLNIKFKVDGEKNKRAKLLRKEDRELIKKAKIALNRFSFEELESKNAELRKELEVLERLEIEMKGK
ncbi:hypothetical protein [Campylobacter helveticus]|uniref:hypothetical protein n=1 Tax=Campylobacter helveticus TaxID=28898 RepID=UPI0011125AB1|nr:hypothetical protein [Campylobacter helveticus]TNB63243.1 hypothetical protein FDW43_04885 [Campylobacter helveticus]TNH33483.1 hypothetical protein FDW46_06635 [Campylobacter helveticus]